MKRLTCFLAIALLAAPASADAPPATAPSVYSTTRPSPDGIGKVYMGREIAEVMGHQGARWLDRRARETEEEPGKVVAALDLKPTDVVADIGAGTGYFSFRLAPKVPQGKVLATDIQQEMLDLMSKAAKKNNVTNVEPILGTVTDPKLPEGAVDLVLMVDAYHEFDHPREMMEGIVRGLKPGGRVVLVEYKAEDPQVFIKPHHKMTVGQVKKEMTAVGLEHMKTSDELPQQHLLFFRKPAAKAAEPKGTP